MPSPWVALNALGVARGGLVAVAASSDAEIAAVAATGATVQATAPDATGATHLVVGTCQALSIGSLAPTQTGHHCACTRPAAPVAGLALQPLQPINVASADTVTGIVIPH